MNDEQIEQEIESKGLTAPRVKLTDISKAIKEVHYFVGGDGVYGAARKAGDNSIQKFDANIDLVTICMLVFHNGFTVVGTSACASPENFNVEIGRRLAYQKASDEAWKFLGFALKQELYQEEVEAQNELAQS